MTIPIKFLVPQEIAYDAVMNNHQKILNGLLMAIDKEERELLTADKIEEYSELVSCLIKMEKLIVTEVEDGVEIVINNENLYN